MADQRDDPDFFLLITLFSAGTYTSLIYLASSMILVPYLWSAAYAVLLSGRGETYEHASAERTKDLLIGGIALSYAVWLLYAGGREIPAAFGVVVCTGGDSVCPGQTGTGQAVVYVGGEGNFQLCGCRGGVGGVWVVQRDTVFVIRYLR